MIGFCLKREELPNGAGGKREVCFVPLRGECESIEVHLVVKVVYSVVTMVLRNSRNEKYFS